MFREGSDSSMASSFQQNWYPLPLPNLKPNYATGPPKRVPGLYLLFLRPAVRCWQDVCQLVQSSDAFLSCWMTSPLQSPNIGECPFSAILLPLTGTPRPPGSQLWVRYMSGFQRTLNTNKDPVGFCPGRIQGTIGGGRSSGVTIAGGD